MVAMNRMTLPRSFNPALYSFSPTLCSFVSAL